MTLSIVALWTEQTFGFIATATMISHCPLSKYVGCKSFIENFSNRIVFIF